MRRRQCPALYPSRVAHLLQAAGFRFASYWNIVLFPLMVLTRKLLPGKGASTTCGCIPRRSTTCAVPRPDGTRLLRCGMRFPFGGSIAVAAKDVPGGMPDDPPRPKSQPGARRVDRRSVYRGADSIGELVAALEQLRIAGGHEIVLVNDGSPDGSLRVCRGLVERALVPITLVDLSRNYGEHNAVMAGLRHATGAHVITMDDDLQNPPEGVERLLAFAQERPRVVTA